MSDDVTPTSVTIIGGGPVACLVAIGLRERSFKVDLFERAPGFFSPGSKGHSFNLTLTRRGLRTLDPTVRGDFYRNGVVMPQRIVHNRNGQIVHQPYGADSDHHLLSIPRDALHKTLLKRAEQAGVAIHFGHECVSVDPRTATASFLTPDGRVYQKASDFLIGCDGANSVVRQEISRHGGRMQISQRYISHGYVEARIPPDSSGNHALLAADGAAAPGRSSEHGLHLWPRGEFFLLAQPNTDHTYSTTLFMPMAPSGDDYPGLSMLDTREAMTSCLTKNFPDLRAQIPVIANGFLTAPPAGLKIITCEPYHFGRTVLLGDAAHTMVPFYGQGINCSFEDVHTFFEILDAELWDGPDPAAITAALAAFTSARAPEGRAIADLSLRNLTELSDRTERPDFHRRNWLERKIRTRFPEMFAPLYEMVAFGEMSYTEAIRRHDEDRQLLDALCDANDTECDAELIVEAFGAKLRALGRAPLLAVGAPPAGGDTIGPELGLTPHQRTALLHSVSSRLNSFHDDVAARRYPASYIHDSTDVMAYSDGLAVAERLREPTAPREGTELNELLDTVFEVAVPNGTIHPHPGFLAHVPSGGLFQAAVGDFLARALNRFVGVWAASPGLSEIESNVIRWFCEVLGYGPGSFGYLTTGGSLANLMAVRCAITAATATPADPTRMTLYCSQQAHFSVAKAAALAGLPRANVRVVPTSADFTMDTHALAAQVEQDRAAALLPCAVVATAGTTNTGAVDDLTAVAAFCRTQGIWFHADACLGGFFRLTDRGQTLLAGIEQADSIAVDAHKSLFLPHGTSALLVAEKERLYETFRISQARYLPGLTTGDDVVDFCNYGPELSREVRGLAAWLPIKMHGMRAFENALDHKLDLAEQLESGLRQLGRVEVVPRGRPHLPVVAFRVSQDDDSQTAKLCERICSRGNVYVTTTELPAVGTVVRCCILHHETEKTVVDQLIEDTQWAINTLK